mgnify:CR=1 FL=1
MNIRQIGVPTVSNLTIPPKQIRDLGFSPLIRVSQYIVARLHLTVMIPYVSRVFTKDSSLKLQRVRVSR